MTMNFFVKFHCKNNLIAQIFEYISLDQRHWKELQFKESCSSLAKNHSCGEVCYCKFIFRIDANTFSDN